MANPATRKREAGAVVLLSGGLDSTVALYRAIADYGSAHALSFEYGQRHWIELAHARRIAGAAYAKHSIITLGSANIGMRSLLTAASGEITEQSSIVPGRNILFMWAAAVYAQKQGVKRIVIGSCAEDQAAYLDCRRKTFDAMELLLELGLGWPGKIVSPYVGVPKVEILRDAKRLGCIDAARSSWSCYDPQPVPGATCDEKTPCGKCPACVKRAAAFAAFDGE